MRMQCCISPVLMNVSVEVTALVIEGSSDIPVLLGSGWRM